MVESQIDDTIYASYLKIPSVQYKRVFCTHRLVLPTIGTGSVLDSTFFINGIGYNLVDDGFNYYMWEQLLKDGEASIGAENQFLVLSNCAVEPFTTNQLSKFYGVDTLLRVTQPSQANLIDSIEEVLGVSDCDYAD